jgi:hypothetical protein
MESPFTPPAPKVPVTTALDEIVTPVEDSAVNDLPSEFVPVHLV